MTAAHQRRAALEVVPDPDETAPAPAVGDDWRSSTVIDQWSPEHQFVGSLLWLSAEQARPLLDLVPDTAIWRPQTRWIYELIRHLVDAGTDPTPVTVLALGRSRPARDALNPDTGPTAQRQRQLALYLFDAYSQAISPAAAITTYAREVLDEAYRRGFDTFGIRMQQLAASGSERADLTDQFAAIRDELADLWRRAEAATKPEGTTT
jgi:replicative DNA helicase